MEPRRNDGDDLVVRSTGRTPRAPQWSPVVRTGTTQRAVLYAGHTAAPQWSPVVMTGTTGFRLVVRFAVRAPQWSPVVMTGTTPPAFARTTAPSRRNGAPS